MDVAKPLLEECEELSKQPGRGPLALKKAQSAIDALTKDGSPEAPAEGQAPSDAAKMLSWACCLAGEVKLALGVAREAGEPLARARALDPASVRALGGYAAAVGATGDADAARQLLNPFDENKTLPVGDLLALGKAYMLIGEEEKGEAMLKAAWSRGGDPIEMANAQIGKYLKLRTQDRVGAAVDGYNQAFETLKGAARLNRKDVRARYKMGLLHEDPYHHNLLFGGGKKEAEGEEGPQGDEVAGAAFKTWSATAMEDEILAIGQMHGVWDPNPTMEDLLQALLAEHKAAGEKGASAEQDTIMVLYNFKCRQLVAKGGKGGKHLKSDKNLTAAAKEYDEAVQANPVPEVMLHLARVHKLMGKPSDAVKVAKAALALDPEYPAAALYSALLEHPLDFASPDPIPGQVMAAAAAIRQCLERAAEAGPSISGMCLGEELCHAVNPDISAAAVGLARGLNAAGAGGEAEPLCRRVLELLPPTMQAISWSSVLQVELGQLCAYAREELLKALQARSAGEEGVPVYEACYAALNESAGKSLPGLDRLIACCRIGLAFRPASAPYHTALADALWRRVDNDMAFEKKENKDKKQASLKEIEGLLRASLALEGQPMYEPQAPPKEPGPTKESHPTQWAVFEQIDANGNGELDKAEFNDALEKFGYGALVGPLLAAMDLDSDGVVTFEEFVKGYDGFMAQTNSMKKAPEAPKVAAKPGGKAPAKGKAAPAAKGKPTPAPKGGKAPAKAAPAGGKDKAAPPEPKAPEPPKPPPPPPIPDNPKTVKTRIDLAQVLRQNAFSGGLTDDMREECLKLYEEARDLEPRNVDACVGIGQLLLPTDAMKACDEMAKFPDPDGYSAGENLKDLKVGKANFDDSFCHIEIARSIIKHATDTKDKALLECEQVEKSLCIAGKVMGWDGIDKWVEILDNKGKWDMLKRIYMAIHEDKEDLDITLVQGYFDMKGWDKEIVPRGS